MRTRQGLRRGQGDSGSWTGHEGLRGWRALGAVWAGSTVGAEGRGPGQICRSGWGDLRESKEVSEGLRNS